ncbi:MAG: Gfo/Idh/MocA family oxidoreductase [Candidatus Diapherotrites archaeon]
MAQKLRAAVIGLGNMGRHHTRVYSELNETQLIGVCDANKELAQEYAKKYSCKAFDSLEELMKQEKPEIVSIAVPTNKHFEATEKVLHYANVLLEKPIAESIESAKKIEELAKKSDYKLMIGHIERFNPVIRFLKKFLIEKNESLLSLSIERLGIAPPKNISTGVTVDLAIHDIDIFRYLTEEEITETNGFAKNFGVTNVDDHCHIFIKGKTASASIVANWVNPTKIRQLRATLKNYFIYLDYISQKIELYEKNELFDPLLEGPTFSTIELQKQEPLKLEILSFIEAVKNNREVEVSAAEGKKNLETALNALKSAEKNGFKIN